MAKSSSFEDSFRLSAILPLAKKFTCETCKENFESKRRLAGHRVGKHVRQPRLRNAKISLEHLTDSQKGYIAAFLDGEGAIQITRSLRKNRDYKLALHPLVFFSNTHRGVIDTLRLWLGVGSVFTREEKLPHKTGYGLHITGTRNIHKLLVWLRPYIIVKAKQVDVVIRYCESRMKHYRGKDRRYNALELKLYSELSELNKRGRRWN